MFIKAHWLAELYEAGDLDKVLKKFKNDINKDTMLGQGTQVCCFKKKDKRMVIKLCPKRIKFFTNPTFHSYKTEINELDPFFIPVLNILYEDSKVFLYTQHICHKIDDAKKNPYVYMSVILMIIAMILKNKIVTDIGPHNIGIYHKNIGIFYCHGLHTIDVERNWYSRLIVNIMKYNKFFSELIQLTEKDIITVFSSKNIREIVKYLNLNMFQPIYNKYIITISVDKQSIINRKLEIINTWSI